MAAVGLPAGGGGRATSWPAGLPGGGGGLAGLAKAATVVDSVAGVATPSPMPTELAEVYKAA